MQCNGNLFSNNISYYACDVTFHEKGLNYGPKNETIFKVVSKCVRTAFCLYGFFDTTKAEIIFATPFASDKIKTEIDKYLMHIENYFKSKGLDYTFKMISDDAYVIEHQSKKHIIIQQAMSLANIPILSSGTKYGINIANLLYSIKTHRYSTYLIDEQFSYVNSDVEAAMLATMASLLGPNEQIFFTTHNTDILSLSFPFHSFYFLNKIENKITV